MPQIRGWVSRWIGGWVGIMRVEGEGGWVNDVLRHR